MPKVVLDPRLKAAIDDENIDEINACVREGIDIHSLDPETGKTPLMYALSKRKDESAVALIETGVDCTLKNENSREKVGVSDLNDIHISIKKYERSIFRGEMFRKISAR